ncbi:MULTISPECIES: DUF3899 domain-containing protein [Mesobacillus]|uniref:DUF3899 domain-containing protein n=1 Tax=Mesobacillus stamsii TaxID=225347 RepID=A0ABU0FUM0_9BACI|nr:MULTISPECIES: DUF3899 domain-containing protein [Mesobacillus]MDQ0413616.1 hypothetical protein [Mesobacillus stamsii]
MRTRFRKIFIGFSLSQFIVLILSLLDQQTITLLSYINISFYIASILIFTSMVVFTVHSGFFDAISYSFRTVFAGKEEKNHSRNDITPLSELITINANPLFLVGLFDFLLMLSALYVYYL